MKAAPAKNAQSKAPKRPAARAKAPRRARLKPLQGWLQHEIVRVVERTATKGAAAEHVLPSPTLAADERVRIYTTMYRMRMLEALETDYPALLHHLGRAEFEALMLDYLRAHPSHHYSLNFLGYALPGYLARESKRKDRGFLADVALVEHSITDVFDAEPAAQLDPKTLAALPPDAFARTRLELVPALRLLELAHDANKAVTELRHGRVAPSTRKERAWVVVYRKEHVVWRMDLEEAAFRVLKALQSKHTLPRAIAAGAGRFRGPPEALQAKLQGWFAEWAGEGFFRAPPARAR